MTTNRVVLVDAVPMSARVAAVPDPRSVIIAIHGGATSSAYFDCPNRPDLSLLRAGAAAGHTVVALDRPGYGASGLYQDQLDDPSRRVALTCGAVDKILADSPRGAGLFFFAHSLGGELALRMIIDRDDVVGLELAGTGLRHQAETAEILDTATLTHRPSGLRELLWAPYDLYPPEVLTGALSAPSVAYEATVIANWARRDFAEVAARVRVPVQYSVAEHERVWDTSTEALAAICGLFAASPRVKVNHVPASGHNLSVGLSAQSYHRRVLSFLEESIDMKEAEVG